MVRLKRRPRRWRAIERHHIRAKKRLIKKIKYVVIDGASHVITQGGRYEFAFNAVIFNPPINLKSRYQGDNHVNS